MRVPALCRGLRTLRTRGDVSGSGGLLRSVGLSLLARCWTSVSNVFTCVPADPEDSPPSSAPVVDEGFVGRLSGQLLRHPGRLAGACLATVLGPAAVVQAGSLGLQRTAETQPAVESAVPAPAPIPGDRASWLPVANEAAATCPGLPAAVLVAIGHVESSLGLQPGPSHAGAVGPMQFLPSTWAFYGADGDRDGSIDVMNTVDAVHGAARLLCAHGAADPERLRSALWNYNHSDDYVSHVIGLARLMPVKS